MKWPLCWACVVLAVAGCGGVASMSEMAPTSSATRRAPRGIQADKAEQATETNVAGDSTAATKVPRPTQRKIIYDATLALVVVDFDKTDSGVRRLVGSHSGYLSDASIDRIQGTVRTGRWVIRVPVDQFEMLLAELEKLGMPETRRQTARDVTAEYVDLEARVTNKRRLEERVLKLLEKRDGKIEEVIKVEHELGRVREEIERMQGQLRLLANRTSLATVTITAREEKDYVPPQAPTFSNRIAENWGGSLDVMLQTAQALVLVVVVLAPWLVPPLLVAGLIWHRWRRRRAARLAAAKPTPVETVLPEE